MTGLFPNKQYNNYQIIINPETFILEHIISNRLPDM